MKNSSGTSPVIGVILIVAITVILAAVIAAFIFAFMDEPKPGQAIYNKTITVAELHSTGLTLGIIDTDGDGYFVSRTILGNGVEVGKSYPIGYYINSDKERVIYLLSVPIPTSVPTPVPTTLNPYKCITGPDGVCK